MGSMSNSNPWSPYDSYNDCSQGICNIYCPQWCYLIFPPPPPPPFFLDDSSSKLSPLLIALIGILASAFVLVTYYTLISKYCHRRCDNSSSEAPGFFSSSAIESGQGTSNAAASAGDGLSDSLIRSIKVYKYRKGDGFVDGSDCSVCLSEFGENESLRLLPKCNHAFHLPCIDTWLKSHSNCPLCRAFVTGAIPTTTIAEADLVVANYSSSVHQTAVESTNCGGETEEINSNLNGYHQQIGDFNSVVVMEDLEIDSRNSNDRSEEQRNTKDEYPQQIWRSVSLNSGTVISIGDVIREIKDEEESAGVGTSQQREEGEENGHGEQKTPPTTEAQRSSGGVSSFLIRSSESMKRSASTGRFMFSRNYRLPI